MAGLPMVLAAGFWIGGVATAVAVAPLLGACAVLTFGGLAARLAGPRWAPLAALALALSLPEQFTSRAAYSEPLAQILFLGGLCLVIDSLEGGAGARVHRRARRPGARPHAAGAHRRGERHPAGDPVLRDPAAVPAAAGGAAAHRPAGRRALRSRGRARAEQAVPGPHQELADPAGAGGRGRGDRDSRGGGGAVAPRPAPGARELAAQRRRRAAGRGGDPLHRPRLPAPGVQPAHPGHRHQPAGGQLGASVLHDQHALGVLVRRSARGAAGNARRRAAGPPLPAGPGARPGRCR